MEERLSDISAIEKYFSEISKFERETTMNTGGSNIYDPMSGTTYYRVDDTNWSMYRRYDGEWSNVNPDLAKTLEILRVMKLKR